MVRIRAPAGAGCAAPSPDKALKAIETVKRLLPLLTPGRLLVRREPNGLADVLLPLIYNGVVVDAIHYNPVTGLPHPKGCPARVPLSSLEGAAGGAAGVESLVRELRVVEAVEYREPERCWVVPIAWRAFIVAHVKVDVEGEEVVPDYKLTGEVVGFGLGAPPAP